uniref:Delta(14)-sterol reductase ERG24 n=1 Tax=Odontella aurita TaxID=265563 RepID=A0A7S4I4X0_9STRA|mmetsp:Transcript_20031/g.57982  ORF Transcript_20031/g.57982 Transcript_20031/m.57982 type:complete len:523 (+) Transcript_20031:62-1630(+)
MVAARAAAKAENIAANGLESDTTTLKSITETLDFSDSVDDSKSKREDGNADKNTRSNDRNISEVSSTKKTNTEESADKDGHDRIFDYEFGGPAGALATTLALPAVVLVLAHFASVGHVDLKTLQFLWVDPKSLHSILCPGCSEDLFILVKCTCGIAAWFLFQVALERCLPCELVKGPPLKDGSGTRLVYRINGHLAFWFTLLVVEVGWPYLEGDGSGTWRVQFGRAPLTLLYDFYTELALATIILCCGLSIYLYLRSFKTGLLLADGGNSGNHFYDFFIGRELNPRWGSFDWKEFCELRPGLIGWALLNMAMMAKQYEKLGYISGSMILVNIFQFLYVWDGLYQERAILTTMDITTDGFGFMLVFGDLAWVPFTYSLQARYLVDHDPNLGLLALAAIVATNCLGYTIFRGANGQKDAFRRNPDAPEVSHLTYLQTKRGTRLLTSGWWGMARKINYTGDWIMGLSWCMVCGFESIVPYYYAIYFAILLVHRSIRDDHMCRAKYGADWEKYKSLVPYRFIPGVI